MERECKKRRNTERANGSAGARSVEEFLNPSQNDLLVPPGRPRAPKNYRIHFWDPLLELTAQKGSPFVVVVRTLDRFFVDLVLEASAGAPPA